MQDRFKFKAVLKTSEFTILVKPYYILEDSYFIDINQAETEFENKYPEECFWDFIDEIKKQDYIQEISCDSDLIITKDLTNLIQSTGLKDKNEKLIFDGDILEFEHSNGKKAVVYWNSERVCYYVKGEGVAYNVLSTIRNDYLTIIGNIYENKELINGL